MAYKPTTGTSILDNDFRLATSEGVYEALQLKQDALPPQSGNADKVLVSDGSDLSWQYAGLGSGNFGTRNVFLGRSEPVNRTTASTCLAIGEGALNSVTTGSNNLAIGYNALQSVTTGVNNFVLGISAGLALTTNQCTIIGHSAGRTNATGANVVYVGFETAQYNTGSSNTAIGFRALRGVSPSSSGSNNVAIGMQAAQLASASNLVVIGRQAGYALTTGSGNILIGETAGDAITTGTSNTIIGDIAGSTTLANTMIFAAGTAERFRVDSSGNMGIGTSSPAEKLDVSGNVKANSAILNGSTSGNITLSAADTTTSYSVKMPASQGSADMLMHNDGSGNLSWNYAGLGSGSYPGEVVILGRDKPAGMTGVSSTIIGVGAGNLLTSGISNNFVGALSGTRVTTGNYNNFFGSQSGRYATGTNNTFMGHAAGRGASAGFSGSTNVGLGAFVLLNATTAAETVAVGVNAGVGLTSGSLNTFLGAYAGYRATTTGSLTFVGNGAGRHATGPNNTAIGTSALKGVDGSTTGLNNLAVGTEALTAITTGGGNVAMGYRAAYTLSTGANNVAIGANALENNNNNSSFALGVLSARFQTGSNVSIGARSLEGSAATPGTGNSNTVIGANSGFATTSGSSNTFLGVFTGRDITSGSSNIFIGGQAGRLTTTGSNNVILGTDQNSANLSSTIIVSAGSAERFRVDSSGNMGIGTSTPTAKLDVNGNIKATSGDVIIDTAGKGLKVKTGTNAKMGTAVFSNTQTVTVNTTAALASSLIFVTQQDGGEYFGVTNKSNGSFDITHGGGNVNAVVAWIIIDPA